MVKNPVALVDQALAKELEKMSEKQLSKVALEVCGYGFEKFGLKGDLIDKFLKVFITGTRDDKNLLKEKFKTIADSLDESYQNIKKIFDNNGIKGETPDLCVFVQRGFLTLYISP